MCTPYTNRNPQGLFGIQFSKKILEIFDFFSRSSVFDVKSNVLFLCNSIFFIEIGCNAAFQRTATSKFDLDGILATPIYIRRTACNGVQREHNKKLNNGLPILHKVPPKRDYGRYFCIMAEKGGTSHGGLTEKLSLFFHAKKQEVNAYGR